MAKITIQEMVKAGVHFGHQTKRWNPKMKPYIYGTRHGVTIFDLTITMRRLAKACEFLRDAAAKGGNIIFVGTKRQSQEVVREAAQETGMYYMADRWLGGTLTNNSVIMTRARYMKKLRGMEDSGEIDGMPNKEASRARRELSKLERSLIGIADMRKLPDVMVVVDIERDHIAVNEANRLGIPVVAVVDSNCDPDSIDYIIPGNDDAVRSIQILMSALVGAIKEGCGLSGREDVPAAAEAAAPATEKAVTEAPVEAAEDTAPAAEEKTEAAPVEEPAIEAEPAEAAAEEEKPAE